VIKDKSSSTKEAPYPPSLAKFIQPECIHEEYEHEVANHRLLELIARLFRHLIKTHSRSYKDLANLMYAIRVNIENFNAAALDSFFS